MIRHIDLLKENKVMTIRISCIYNTQQVEAEPLVFVFRFHCKSTFLAVIEMKCKCNRRERREGTAR